MVEGLPVVKSLSLSTQDGDLSDHDPRPPLRGRLVPDAMEAAGFPADVSSNQKSTYASHDDHTTALAGRLHYNQASQSRIDEGLPSANVRRSLGRPQHRTDPAELQLIADAYNRRRSVSDVLAVIPSSRSTAHRRLREAFDAGLVKRDSSSGLK